MAQRPTAPLAEHGQRAAAGDGAAAPRGARTRRLGQRGRQTPSLYSLKLGSSSTTPLWEAATASHRLSSHGIVTPQTGDGVNPVTQEQPAGSTGLLGEARPEAGIDQHRFVEANGTNSCHLLNIQPPKRARVTAPAAPCTLAAASHALHFTNALNTAADCKQKLHKLFFF